MTVIAVPHVLEDDKTGVGGVDGYTIPVADPLVQDGVFAVVPPHVVVFIYRIDTV